MYSGYGLFVRYMIPNIFLSLWLAFYSQWCLLMRRCIVIKSKTLFFTVNGVCTLFNKAFLFSILSLRILSILSSRSVTVLPFIFSFTVLLELTFVYGVNKGQIAFFFSYRYPFVPASFIEKISFLYCFECFVMYQSLFMNKSIVYFWDLFVSYWFFYI